MATNRVKNYDRLRELLTCQAERDGLPIRYMHKFIGKNSAAFTQGVAELETRFSNLEKQSVRHTHSQGHLALTYTFEAHTVEEIITVLRATDEIADLIIVM